MTDESRYATLQTEFSALWWRQYETKDRLVNEGCKLRGAVLFFAARADFVNTYFWSTCCLVWSMCRVNRKEELSQDLRLFGFVDCSKRHWRADVSVGGSVRDWSRLRFTQLGPFSDPLRRNWQSVDAFRFSLLTTHTSKKREDSVDICVLQRA